MPYEIKASDQWKKTSTGAFPFASPPTGLHMECYWLSQIQRGTRNHALPRAFQAYSRYTPKTPISGGGIFILKKNIKQLIAKAKREQNILINKIQEAEEKPLDQF